MNKIFFSISLLVLAGWCGTAQGVWSDDMKRERTLYGMLLPSYDEYWVNNFSKLRTYPVIFYSQAYEEKYNKDNITEEKSEEVNTHEFEHNVVVSAALGQRMVDAETFTINHQKIFGHEYAALEDGVIYNSLNEIKIKKGQKFAPIGEVKINGEYYLLFEDKDSEALFMIDEDGAVKHNVGYIYKGKMMLSTEITVVRPRDLLFEPTTDTDASRTEPETKFEISYDGMQEDEFYLLYTAGEEAERHVYDIDEKNVEINGTKLEIINVFPDYIEYKILD